MIERAAAVHRRSRFRGYIRAHDGVWFATGEEIVRHWLQSGATS